ncbi:MAG TPA: hypothetical protein VHS80_13240 [Chthoniobacterales bacterium]|nr:hypothetical protein [Chthoniobacterales bacterium]
MNLDELRKALGNGAPEEQLEVVRYLEPSCQSVEQAYAYLWAIMAQLLRAGRLVAAAAFLWGLDLFDARPQSVKRIFRAIEAEAKLILLGCGSAGKTYTTAAWFLLDWLKDPLYTNSKVISTSAGHAKANVFSTLNMLHESAIIALPGERLDGFIGCSTKNRHAGISRVSIPQGTTGRGALQGFHPLPRSSIDPVFGPVGRVRAFIDEAEEVPLGLWSGLSNMLLSMKGSNLIKVICACNPRNVLSPLANEAQPDKGWNRVVIDEDKEWMSKERWKVVRIDGADLENVVQQTEVYPGFMTFSGYENLRMKGGGNTPDYYTMARGMYPLEGVANTVIPISFLDQLFGTLVFVGRSIPCGGLDVAFEGDDEVIFFAGRYGLCSGYRLAREKEVTMFDEPRYCYQGDQWYSLPKLRTLELAEAVVELCGDLNIGPDWMLVDRTGNGTGVHDALLSNWSPLVHGVNWGMSATDKRVLEDDSHKAIEEFDGIDTEMYMTLRKWIEFDYCKLSPNMDVEKLNKELTQRRYQLVGKGPTGLGRVAIQSKKEFKKINGWSPDRADGLVMCLHQARLNGPEKARMTLRRPRIVKQTLGPVEKMPFVIYDRSVDA